MKECENGQPPKSAAPAFDELAIEALLEISDEFLVSMGTILEDSGGVPGKDEEKRINELLSESNMRLNELLAQKRREKIK